MPVLYPAFFVFRENICGHRRTCGRNCSDRSSHSCGYFLLIALPFYMLQYEFQSYFAAAEKQQLGLAVTIASGLTNMILDALFMAVFH